MEGGLLEITESWKWASRAGLREAAFGGERHPRGSKSIGEGRLQADGAHMAWNPATKVWVPLSKL